MPQMKHHFNVYIGTTKLFTKSEVREAELDLERIITERLSNRYPVEVAFVETFDADKEETGGAPSVHACGDPDCVVPHPAPHKQFPGYGEGNDQSADEIAEYMSHSDADPGL